jgi:hypothetical protein
VTADRIGAPKVGEGANAEFELASRLGLLEEAFAWVEDEPGLRATLGAYFPSVPLELTGAYLAGCAEQLDKAEHIFDLEAIDASELGLRHRLEEAVADAGSSYLWIELRDAFGSRDWPQWDEVLDEARRLQLLRPNVERLQLLSERLSAFAPVWTWEIRSSRGDEETCGSLASIEEAWTFAEAETWLKRLMARGDVIQLQRRLENSLAELSRLSVRTTAASAWLSLAVSLTDEQRSSLVAWVASLKKVGKGTGKYAGRWRAVAQKEMRKAVGAVPVWIMPTYRVVESIDPGVLDAFDVLIVDEASQSDLISISLLGIARKVVIVGDDKQISPQSFMNQESVGVKPQVRPGVNDVPRHHTVPPAGIEPATRGLDIPRR